MSNTIDRRALLSRGAWLAAGAALGWLAARTLPWDLLARTEDSPGHEERFRKLKLELPKVETPKGLIFVPTVRVGDMLYVSGHIASRNGKPVVGKVGKDLKTKEARAVAREVGLVVLAAVRKELGSLDKVVRLVKTLGMVNCTPDFTEQPEVINGFSELMTQVFGEKAGKGTRSAVGMGSLPRGTPVEVEALLQVKG
jgi:enamine deaminase RidA (YjgF/YER057c/UK114 family)